MEVVDGLLTADGGVSSDSTRPPLRAPLQGPVAASSVLGVVEAHVSLNMAPLAPGWGEEGACHC